MGRLTEAEARALLEALYGPERVARALDGLARTVDEVCDAMGLPPAQPDDPNFTLGAASYCLTEALAKLERAETHLRHEGRAAVPRTASPTAGDAMSRVRGCRCSIPCVAFCKAAEERAAEEREWDRDAARVGASTACPTCKALIVSRRHVARPGDETLFAETYGCGAVLLYGLVEGDGVARSCGSEP